MLRREEGQILPLLVTVIFVTLVLGFGAFQVGRAAVFRSEAQTAADAAALAGARDVRQQLLAMYYRDPLTVDIAAVNRVQVQAAARDYAERNGGRLVFFKLEGVDVKVGVDTQDELGKQARSVKSDRVRGEAKARARVNLVSSYAGVSSGGSIGPLPGGGSTTISDAEWEEFAKTIHDPPRCTSSSDPSDNDVVALGLFLQSHGALVGENNAFANQVDMVHTEGSWHYRCNFLGALDVNYAGNEPAIIDGLIGNLQKLGFRTIWRAPGHWDHLHVDAGCCGSLGAGFGVGGALGSLEDQSLSIKLIDYDAPPVLFAFGGGAGGYYGGPPDPAVARVICSVLDRHDSPPRVRLAAFEAAIVESGVHNLNYGDRDSLGVFQQRPSQGWGSAAQILDPEYAATQFVTRAIAADRGWMSAGQLAQSVQRSAFPERYDQVAGQAQSLLNQYCG